MLTIITILFTSFLIALSGAAMPGPLMSVTISESVRRGFVSGPLLVLGHNLLELALLILLMFGLAPLLKQDWVFAAIALLGGVMLGWMGIGMLRAAPTMSMTTDVNGKGGRRLVLTGMLVSVSSPYWSLWWATIGLGYVLYCTRYGTIGIVSFFIGHILGDLAWYCALSWGIGKGRHLLSDTHYRALIGACGLFLVLMAGYFVWSGTIKALSLS